MPIFDYICPNCGNHFDKYVTPGDTEPQTCPKCRHIASQLEYSVPARRNPDKGIQR